MFFAIFLLCRLGVGTEAKQNNLEEKARYGVHMPIFALSEQYGWSHDRADERR